MPYETTIRIYSFDKLNPGAIADVVKDQLRGDSVAVVYDLESVDYDDLGSCLSDDEMENLGFIRCSECDAWTHPGAYESEWCTNWCYVCDRVLCYECYWYCEHCGEHFCSNHITNDGNTTLCEDCLSTKEEMERNGKCRAKKKM